MRIYPRVEALKLVKRPSSAVAVVVASAVSADNGGAECVDIFKVRWDSAHYSTIVVAVVVASSLEFRN